MTSVPEPIILGISLHGLLPDLRKRLEEAKDPGGQWDPTRLDSIVAREFGFLAPYTRAKIESASVGGATQDILLIEFAPPSDRDPLAAERRFDKATARAERGEVDAALRDLTALVAVFPEVAKYRRALGQCYLVRGDFGRAEDEFLRSLALDPRDPAALTLLGNLYARQEAPEKAVPLYRKSLAVERNVYALTNLGASLMETGEIEEGITALRDATGEDEKHPNAWYGLGLALSRKQDLSLLPEAIQSLDKALAVVGERGKASQIWDESRRLLDALSEIEAREEWELAKAAIEATTEEEGRKGGMPVDIEEQRLPGVLAKIEFGWVHKRSHHRLLVSPQAGVLREHYVLHELEHLRLANLARGAGRNRWFASTAESRERAIRSFKVDISRISRNGLPEEALTPLVGTWVDGLLLQLFNFPIDLLIERRILSVHPQLRELVYNSLKDQLNTAARIVQDKRLLEMTPKVVFRGNAAMNGAFALWFEEVYPRRADFVSIFQRSDSWASAKQLYGAWTKAARKWEPGAEYDWVDDWAERLGLSSWYKWVDGNP